MKIKHSFVVLVLFAVVISACQSSVKKAEEKSNEKHRLKEAEYRKKIEDAQKANEDLKRKLEQGSQQLQGEVLELELEESEFVFED